MTTKPTLLLRGESTGSRRSTGKFRAVPKLPFKPTSFTIAEESR